MPKLGTKTQNIMKIGQKTLEQYKMGQKALPKTKKSSQHSEEALDILKNLKL
jgi:hypothetical protein